MNNRLKGNRPQNSSFNPAQMIPYDQFIAFAFIPYIKKCLKESLVFGIKPRSGTKKRTQYDQLNNALLDLEELYLTGQERNSFACTNNYIIILNALEEFTKPTNIRKREFNAIKQALAFNSGQANTADVDDTALPKEIQPTHQLYKDLCYALNNSHESRIETRVSEHIRPSNLVKETLVKSAIEKAKNTMNQSFLGRKLIEKNANLLDIKNNFNENDISIQTCLNNLENSTGSWFYKNTIAQLKNEIFQARNKLVVIQNQYDNIISYSNELMDKRSDIRYFIDQIESLFGNETSITFSIENDAHLMYHGDVSAIYSILNLNTHNDLKHSIIWLTLYLDHELKKHPEPNNTIQEKLNEVNITIDLLLELLQGNDVENLLRNKLNSMYNTHKNVIFESTLQKVIPYIDSYMPDESEFISTTKAEQIRDRIRKMMDENHVELGIANARLLSDTRENFVRSYRKIYHHDPQTLPDLDSLSVKRESEEHDEVKIENIMQSTIKDDLFAIASHRDAMSENVVITIELLLNYVEERQMVGALDTKAVNKISVIATLINELKNAIRNNDFESFVLKIANEKNRANGTLKKILKLIPMDNLESNSNEALIADLNTLCEHLAKIEYNYNEIYKPVRDIFGKKFTHDCFPFNGLSFLGNAIGTHDLHLPNELNTIINMDIDSSVKRLCFAAACADRKHDFSAFFRTKNWLSQVIRGSGERNTYKNKSILMRIANGETSPLSRNEKKYFSNLYEMIKEEHYDSFKENMNNTDELSEHAQADSPLDERTSLISSRLSFFSTQNLSNMVDRVSLSLRPVFAIFTSMISLVISTISD